MRRARHVLAAVAGLAAAMVAVAPASAVPAEAPSEITAMAAQTLDGRPVDGPATALEVADYWTPERMRVATPADGLQVSGQRPVEPRLARPGSNGPTVLDEKGARPVAEAAREFGDRLGAAVTVEAIGRVFFIDPRDMREHYCSASILRSTKGKMVLTAGHCVVEANQVHMLNWTFAPDYLNNTTRYAAMWFVIPNNWLNNVNIGYDYAIAVMSDPLAHTFGGHPLLYDAPTSGVTVEAYGFPGSGSILAGCSGTTVSFPTSVHQVGLPCDENVLSEGASGGPWIVRSHGYDGYVNGVNGSYTDPPNVLYTPYFDILTAEMWVYAETTLS